MIPATQQQALGVLAELCELSPDVRLGQLFPRLGFIGEDQTGRSLGNIGDEQLLAVLYHHRAELIERQAGNTNQPLGQVGGAAGVMKAAKTTDVRDV